MGLDLNHLRHLDPLGTITLFLVGFGWGKPVYVNPSAFRISPRTGMALTAVAGPLSNIVTATVFGLFFRFFLFPSAMSGLATNPGGPSEVMVVALQLVHATAYINVVLAVFN